MPKETNVVDSKLLILEAKRNAIYEYMQSTYDSSTNIDLKDPESRERFLRDSSNIESVRSDFQCTLDQLNSRLLEVNPNAKPDFKSLISFEQLYSNVKRFAAQCQASESRPEAVFPYTSRPKLAPIEIVPFAGDIRTWPLFYESFNSNVNSNPLLTDADKLYYLLGKLSGKAQSTIAGITPCPTNYNLILQTLKDKYEDKRTLAAMHLSNVLEFKSMTSASTNNFNSFNEKLVSAVRALKNLELDDLSDFIFLHIALSKLDSETVRSFEMNPADSCATIPTFDSLVDFVQNQAKILQRISSPSASPSTPTQKKGDERARTSKNKTSPPNYLAYVNTEEKPDSRTREPQYKCLCSNVTHQHLFKCPSFMKLTPENRFKTVKEHGSCVNCLSVLHRTSACTSNALCRVCLKLNIKSKHHTLLHFTRESSPNRSQKPFVAADAQSKLELALVPVTKQEQSDKPGQATGGDVALCSHAEIPPLNNTTVLIATAQVATYDSQGKRVIIRCLVDTAAQSHFITDECRVRLGIPSTGTRTAIVKGFGGSEKSVTGSVEFKFSSRYNSNIKFNISAKVTDKITEFVPTAVVDTTSLSHLKGIPLADDMFATPNKIDVLLGASLFTHLLLPGVIRGNPPALESVLGYIIMGSVPTLPSRPAESVTACCVVDKSPIDKLVSKFWELEELPSAPIQSRDDIECEDFYRTSTKRDSNSGRYVESLPLRDDVYSLGDSMQSARKRFMCLERKLEASPKLRAAYDDVIKEHIEKDYISPAPVDNPDQSPLPSYVIPHHGVIREDKTSTPSRVVLDASNNSSSGRSLNDFKIPHHGVIREDKTSAHLRVVLDASNNSSSGHSVNDFKIPRYLGVTDDCVVTLVGFGDASESAYGGVVYLHVSTALGNTVSLVCAKSKVAPSPPRTIAQLELCGAVILSKLLRIALNNLSARLTVTVNVHAFLDSKVALYWIKSSPHRWKTFVANRVVQVTENLSAESFHHVAGTENPADCLSRGSTPEKLLSNPLWLHGPQWLSSDVSQWPIVGDNVMPEGSVPEEKILAHPVTSTDEHSVLLALADRMSSWPKLLRAIVYIYRFMKVLPRRGSAAVSVADLDFAEAKLLQAVQHKYFSDELSALKSNQPVPHTFNKLRPFLHEGLIRVGGRLDNADLAFTAKHPVMLPRQDRVVELLIGYYHTKYLHAGPELVMSRLRQRYWILAARRIVRQIIHKCNTCFRMKPRPTFPLMASLPSMRTTPAIKAFSHTGCDYAGPIPYSPIRRRGFHSEKAYLCIFTCMTTRAVHIELTTSLSTPSFLDALKRFLARRGPVLFIYSDNGTNFQGANSYLRDLYKFINNEYRPRFEQELAENRIQFKFNCPTMPHAGGCWESMVKVIKNHLFKVIGQQLLTYEELNTVLVQVESLLNSRPLTVLSSDPAEPTALTPSHFLQTAPLCSLPAPEVSSDNLTLLQRHSLLDKLVQSFWERWRLEYLHGLQVREKWNTPSVPIKPGTVVVIIMDNAPPLAWPLAIVDRVHSSKDGVVRVVTVKTAKGIYLRPVVRLCPLPTQ